jgi:hypothetical protein
MVVGLVMSLLIPRRTAPHRPGSPEEHATELLDALAAYEPFEPLPDVALDPRRST